MERDLLPVRGVPASPYTRKMLAVLRYRQIPYRFVQEAGDEDLPEPRVSLIPVFYFPDNTGAPQAEVDSTPIIRKLEQEYPGRSIIPEDPVVAFLNYLLEDYGDEWLTKAMFHYRWYYDDDIHMAGSILPFYRAGVSQPDESIDQLNQIFADRQISRLYVVGSNDTTAPVIEDSYRRFLAGMNEHLKTLPFLLGSRPSSSDFACFGQLTQLTQFDPTPSRLAIREFPRIHAWVSKTEDLSGWQNGEFLSAASVPDTLKNIFSEIGRTYVPVMLANAQAVDQGMDKVETTLEGKPWEQVPFPYQAKCLQWLRVEFAKLSEEERESVLEILNGTGCERLLRKAE